ncbi:MAG: response regulator, partial [Clostridia bacterium]
YDAILMDIQMPLMDGYEATKAIRASNHPESKTIPIIAMTANAFSEDIVASHTAGMNDHISKPIDINQMLETLKKHIR